MEPVGNILDAMWKVVSAIVNAGKTARRNKARCRELALRAKEIKGVLREYRKVASGDAASATTRRILGRLKGAIDDALKLAESCGRRSRSDGGLLSRLQLHRLVASDGLATKLDEVNSRITTCLVDLQAANVVRMMDYLNAANGKKMMDKLATGARDHRRGNNPNNPVIRENNGGKGGRRRRGNKAAGQPPQPRRPRAVDVAGVPICHVHHHFMIEEEGSTSCSVM